GQTWSAAQILRSTELASDYPLLVRDKEALFLSWHSDEFGYSFSLLAGREGS
ncbi:MAG TPA: glycosyl hydrolase, partial [Gammaproteobacteria bacterium]|nr:glycosyl hydrolase [Gammaproteobacteria bacterium]